MIVLILFIFGVILISAFKLKPRNQKIAHGVLFFIAAFFWYYMNIGLFSKYYDIQWTEEVLLHNGEIIDVDVKQTFRRRNLNQLVGGLEDTQISFTYKNKKIEKMFAGYSVRLIDQKNGEWFFIPKLSSTISHPKLVNRKNQILKMKISDEFIAVSIDELPSDFKYFNMLPMDAMSSTREISGKRLTLDEKYQMRTLYGKRFNVPEKELINISNFMYDR
jgi:hypothetical protein